MKIKIFRVVLFLFAALLAFPAVTFADDNFNVTNVTKSGDYHTFYTDGDLPFNTYPYGVVLVVKPSVNEIIAASEVIGSPDESFPNHTLTINSGPNTSFVGIFTDINGGGLLSNNANLPGYFYLLVTDNGQNYYSNPFYLNSSGLMVLVPDITMPSTTSIHKKEIYTAQGSFTDPDSQNWTATVNYGDGSGTQLLNITALRTFTLNHDYPKKNATYTVTVAVTDDQGSIGTGTSTVITFKK